MTHIKLDKEDLFMVLCKGTPIMFEQEGSLIGQVNMDTGDITWFDNPPEDVKENCIDHLYGLITKKFKIITA